MIRLDPRTKLGLMILTVIYSAVAPSNGYECVWIFLIWLLGAALGCLKKTTVAAVLFTLLWVIALYGLPLLDGTIHTSLLAWLGLVFKCYPSVMLAGVVISTTQVSEFMAAMYRMRVPKEVVIPLAIMFRYFPVIKEDWAYIKDAMSLRGLEPTPLGFVKQPEQVIEALYVPMLVAASRAADELSVAAITRGIEKPGQRTSRLDIRFSEWDVVVFLLFFAALIGAIV